MENTYKQHTLITPPPVWLSLLLVVAVVLFAFCLLEIQPLSQLTTGEQQECIGNAADKDARKVISKLAETSVVKLPDKFRSFRVVVEITPDIPMTKETIFENVQKICNLIITSPTVDKIDALAVAGSCVENGKTVFRVLGPVKKEK